MKQPTPVAGQNPAIKTFLAPFAEEIVRRTKTSPRNPLQHPLCHHTAGTLSCLEAGGSMCMECRWWASIAGDED